MDSSIPASARADTSAAGAPAARASRARRTRWMALGGGVFVLVLVVVALAAPLIAPYDPIRQSLRGRLAAPTLAGADGKAHLLGTDHLGRDVLSRAIYGARVSLLVGLAAVVV
ncbi:MAG TPA: ABC transporter permease, partial [Candidatus Binatia bacterium]|nr:ABC transporter permease [Candidatus Binatia bacterium]